MLFGFKRRKEKQRNKILDGYSEYSNLKPADYKIIEELKENISSDVEAKAQELINHHLIDEFSDGSYLDVYIHCRFNLIRNNLKKQQIKHEFTIQSIENIIRTEIERLKKEIEWKKEEWKHLQ